jgi:tape measure domain-containing protein
MVAGGTLATIGVEAVVEGVADFVRDLAEMSKSVTGFGDRVGLLERIFNAIITPIKAFLGFLRDVAVVAGGILMRDAILFLIDGLRSIIDETIRAGAEFQKLKVRLDTLIARQLIGADTSLKFGDALAQATDMANDLFREITQLALTSPFDIEDVANVLSLATSYGFARDAALEVTQAVIDFASGMGLSNIEAERVIVNLGQMIQLGKVTQREMTDLARGAFVPVNDVLKIMADNLGITTDQLAKMRKDGILPASTFIEAFIQLVGEEFPGAAQRASRTIEGVTGNLKDLVQGLIGFNVVRPILDAIADPLANIIDAISADPRVIETAERIGAILADMTTNLLGFLPSAEDLADFIITKFGIMADILGAIISGNFDVALMSILNLVGLTGADLVSTFLKIKEIVAGFEEGGILGGLGALGIKIPKPILDFIDDIQTAFGNLRTFLEENGPEIMGIIGEIFGAFGEVGAEAGGGLLDIIGNIVVGLSEALVQNGPQIVEALRGIKNFIVDDLLPGLRDFGQWLSDNKEILISVFGSAALATVFAALTVLSGLFVFLFLSMLPIIIVVLAVVAGFVLLVAIIFAVFQTFLALLGLPNLLTPAFEKIREKATEGWDNVKAFLSEKWEQIKEAAIQKWQALKIGVAIAVEDLKAAVKQKFEDIKAAIAEKWEDIKATARLAWESLKLAIIIKIDSMKDAIARKFAQLKEKIKAAVDWVSLGKSFVEGVARGIKNNAIKVKNALLNMAKEAWRRVKEFFGAKSPSRLMMGLGEDIIAGLTKGILGMSNMPAIALGATAAQATQTAANVVAAAPVVGGATTINNNNTLNIATSAPHEPMVTDFQQLMALGSAGR